jgi:hypothetical protein
LLHGGLAFEIQGSRSLFLIFPVSHIPLTFPLGIPISLTFHTENFHDDVAVILENSPHAHVWYLNLLMVTVETQLPDLPWNICL